MSGEILENKKDDGGLTFKKLLSQNLRQYGIVGALIILVIFFQIATDGLLLLPNSFVALIQQNSYVLILSMGMVMIIIATHIDLSVGSQVAFIGGVLAIMMEKMHVPWFLAILAAICIGLLIGCWHGFWIAYVGIPGFITTLAGMLLFRGLSTLLVGESIPIRSQQFRFIAKGYLPNIFGFVGPFDVLTLVVGGLLIVGTIVFTFRGIAAQQKAGIDLHTSMKTWKILTMVIGCAGIAFVTYLLASSGNADQGGIPITLVIIGILFAIYTFITTSTVFGRHVYSVGGNRKAAILSGINTKLVDFKLYIHMGFLTSIAAIVMLSRSASATAVAGQEFEMDAIAACFIGGTAVTGGKGTIPGAMIGAFVMGVLNQGLSLLGISSAWVKAIKGLVLLLAVAIDIISKKKKG
ncbi:MAG: sugar ABC transporter permease [Clostridiales Family XIII bacterium]|jgi:putative multiple sugar transport system permease protein|nr:sugar ABC transporter permease [Clostridiales Family XIII bacterium]